MVHVPIYVSSIVFCNILGQFPLRTSQHKPKDMSRKNVLFYLLPISNQAKDVLNNQENAFLVDRAGPVTRLAIGHFQSKAKNRTTLATIGRLGDITLRGTGYSRYQCSFHVDLNTNVIMFYDDSRAGTSSVLGPDSTPFRPGQPRKVVVQPNVNTIIGSEFIVNFTYWVSARIFRARSIFGALKREE